MLRHIFGLILDGSKFVLILIEVEPELGPVDV